MLSRIDQGLIFYFQPDRDFFRSIRIRFKIFQQTLIEKTDEYLGVTTERGVAYLVNFSQPDLD